MSSRRLDLFVFLKRIWMKMLSNAHLDALTIGLQLCRSLRGVRGERTAALRLNENGSTLGNYSTQSSVSWWYSEFISFHSDFEYMESDKRFCIVAYLSLQLAKKRIRNRRTCSPRRQMGIAFFSYPFFLSPFDEQSNHKQPLFAVIVFLLCWTTWTVENDDLRREGASPWRRCPPKPLANAMMAYWNSLGLDF